MPKKLINTGTSNDSGNGDSLRSAFTKINENFNELYTLTGSSSTASEVDIKGSVFADDSTLIVDGVNGILNGGSSVTVARVLEASSTLMTRGVKNSVTELCIKHLRLHQGLGNNNISKPITSSTVPQSGFR